MPATFEAVFVLLVFLAPGFIAIRVKNSLLPYRIPSAFQEAVEAAVASTILLPVWGVFAWRLLHARAHLLDAAAKQTPVDVLGVGAPLVGVLALVYFVFSPVVGIAYALMQTHRPYVRIWFKEPCGAIGGAVQFAGLSPSGRQLFLVPSEGVPQSLVRFDKDGAIVEELTTKTDGVWIDVNSEVLRIELID